MPRNASVHLKVEKIPPWKEVGTTSFIYGGVSKNRGTPKWMVYNGKLENPIETDDLGVPLSRKGSGFSGLLHFLTW